MAKWMLIDVTTVEETKVLLVTDSSALAAEHGKIAIANGRKVIAPPVEGRGFSKLDKLQLQYLYWNICSKAPPEDYATVIRDCLLLLRVMPTDRTPLNVLQAQNALLYPDGELAPPITAKAARAPKDPSTARPKVKSTCGMIWELADEALEELGGFKGEETDWKAVRAKVVEVATFDGIHQGTVGVQYGKWKASKLAAVAA
jgi:hypothetical protein